MVDKTNIASYHKLPKRQRVHIFLAGLEGDFEQVRSEILRKDPIPELEECYALVQREDVRRGVINGQLECGTLFRHDPFWRIRTESGMLCYHPITQNHIFAEAISKLGKPINIYI